jgi:hypothetical protein
MEPSARAVVELRVRNHNAARMALAIVFFMILGSPFFGFCEYVAMSLSEHSGQHEKRIALRGRPLGCF